MPRQGQLYKLTEVQIKNLRPKEKLYRKSDGGGLFIVVKPNGAKFWQFRYKGNSKTVSYGPYPQITLKTARQFAQQDRELIAAGKDPLEERRRQEEARKEEEDARRHKEENTFEAVAKSYLEHYRQQRAPSYWDKVESYFHNDIFPFIGQKYIGDITPKEIIEVCKNIEGRGAIDTAKRIFRHIRRIYDFAIAHQIVEKNPAALINPSIVFKKAEKGHYPTIKTAIGIGRLMANLQAYEKDAPIVANALIFLALTAVRPGNIRFARRADLDMHAKIWRIPPEQVKTKEELIIPLSRQAIEIIDKMERLIGPTEYIFPSPKYLHSPMSDNTLSKALRDMGYVKGAPENIVPHGFRHMFSTVAHEQGKEHHAIETQQGHKVGSAVSQAYNQAIYLNQRRELMQWWADFLDDCIRIYLENPKKRP